MPANTSLNFGTTMTIKIIKMAVATTSTAHGIKHGRDDFAFDLLRFSMNSDKARENDFEHTAEFAGFHHVDEEAIENFGVLSKTLGKCAAPFDGESEFAMMFLSVDFFPAFPKREGRARGANRRPPVWPTAGKGRQHLRFYPAAEAGNLDVDLH
jgi:hypothetical protein